jgi:hypothetical protein
LEDGVGDVSEEVAEVAESQREARKDPERRPTWGA